MASLSVSMAGSTNRPRSPAPGAADEMPITSHVVLRPFTATEAKQPFEHQPVARPVVDVNPANHKAIRLLDPGLKYKVKREWATQSAVHCFAPDGDAATAPTPAATLGGVVASTSAQMAQNIFEGYNATAVVFGHGKSGKSTTLFGDMGVDQKDDDDEKPAAAAASSGSESPTLQDFAPVTLSSDAGLLPRFCNDLYEAFSRKPSNSKMTVTVEAVGIEDPHNITDMVKRQGPVSKHVDPEPLKVREEAAGPQVTGTNKRVVSGPASMLEAVKHGVGRYRKFKARATTHLIVIVHCVETMTFADPNAPSENITKTGHATAYFALVVGRPTAFFRCVDSAAQRDKGENEKAKVPFRESSLTRLLQDFFGANTFSYSFACIAPHHTAAKDAVVVLDIATKIEYIKTHPRISYDETTTEFRKLDNEVNTLNSELSAAKEAHEVVQSELDKRHRALEESKRIHREQSAALEELHEQKGAEELVRATKELRLRLSDARQAAREEALEAEIRDAEQRSADLTKQAEEHEAAIVEYEAVLASEQAAQAEMATRRSAAEAEISRQEARYAEVELCQQGLGAIHDQVEADFKQRIGAKEEETAAMEAETTSYEAKQKEIEQPLRVTQLAADSLENLRKRVEAAKKKKQDLAKEEAALPDEIKQLEADVARLDKEANAGCCVVM